MKKNHIKKLLLTGISLLFFVPVFAQAAFTDALDANVLDFTFDGINMWTANGNSRSVTKLMPGTASPGSATYSMSEVPVGIASDRVNAWTINSSNNVSKITPTGVVTTYTSSGAGKVDIAFDGTNMWAVNQIDKSVTRITPTGGMKTYTGLGNAPMRIAFDGTNMWVTNSSDNSVTKISPAGAMTTYTGTGSNPKGVAFDGTNMWTGNSDSVTKISLTGGMTTYPTVGGLGLGDMAFDGTNMWATGNGGVCATASCLVKISPTGGMLTYGVGGTTSIAGVIFDGANIWTLDKSNHRLSMVNPIPVDLTVSSITPTSVALGSAVTLSANVVNTGTQYTGAGNIASPLSNSFQFATAIDGTGAGALIPGTTLGGLDSGTQKPTTYSWTPTTAGTYYVRVCADNTTAWVGNIPESNEANNCGPWTAVVVTAPVVSLPDLVAGVVSSIGGAVAGSPVNLSATITNSGTANTSVTFSNIFQFASDALGTGATTPVAGTSLSGLIKGGSQSTSYSWTPTTAGTYYVRVCADNTTAWIGSIAESNEANNCGAWTAITVAAATSGTTTTTTTTFKIVSSAGTGGTISPLGNKYVAQGNSQTYTITPDTGYQIASLLVDNIAKTIASSYRFSNVQTAHTISAAFSVATMIPCTTCPPGQGSVGTMCAPLVCPSGQHWNGTACVINPVNTGSVTYSTPGTYSWTVPLGVNSIFLTMRGAAGGGGGGGGGTGTTADLAGEGGNGGALSQTYSRQAISVMPMTTYTITVGAGGTGGIGGVFNSMGVSGSAGGVTSFKALGSTIASLAGSAGGKGGYLDSKTVGSTGALGTYTYDFSFGPITATCNCKGANGAGTSGGLGGGALTDAGSHQGADGTLGGGGGGGGGGTFLGLGGPYSAGRGGKGSDGSVTIEW